MLKYNMNDSGQLPVYPKKPGLIFKFFYLISFILIPASFITYFIIRPLYQADFYTSILKRIDLLSIAAKAHSREYQNTIENEMKNNKEIKQTYHKFTNSQKTLVTLTGQVDTIRQTDRYIYLKNKIKTFSETTPDRAETTGLDSLSMEDLKTQVKVIEKSRRRNKRLTGKIETHIAELKKELINLNKIIKKNEITLLEMIHEKTNTLISKIYQDLSLFSPIFTIEWNNFIIDDQLKPIIENYINYFINLPSPLESQTFLSNISEADFFQFYLPAARLSFLISPDPAKPEYKYSFFQNHLKNKFNDIKASLKTRGILLNIIIKSVPNYIKKIIKQGNISKSLDFKDEALIFNGLMLRGVNGYHATRYRNIFYFLFFLRHLLILLPIIFMIIYFIKHPIRRVALRQLAKIIFYPFLFISIIFFIFTIIREPTLLALSVELKSPVLRELILAVGQAFGFTFLLFVGIPLLIITLIGFLLLISFKVKGKA